jgi:hypothetical protein
MDRLRDKRPIPGSTEELLIEVVKACQRLEPSPASRRRTFARVLNAVLGRLPRNAHRSRLRPTVAVVLMLAGLTVASTIGFHWISRSQRPPDDPRLEVSWGSDQEAMRGRSKLHLDGLVHPGLQP